MYVVPLETVLRMTRLRPHQELKEEGLLVKFDPARGKLGRFEENFGAARVCKSPICWGSSVVEPPSIWAS